jgi:predicted PurR-regulated permease PerM
MTPLRLFILAIFGYIEFPCVRIYHDPLQLFILATFGYYIDNEILVWLDWIPSNHIYPLIM